MVWPHDTRARREIMLEASFYGLDRAMVAQSLEEVDQNGQLTNTSPQVTWRSNVIFIGSQNIDSNAIQQVLSEVQCEACARARAQSLLLV